MDDMCNCQRTTHPIGACVCTVDVLVAVSKIGNVVPLLTGPPKGLLRWKGGGKPGCSFAAQGPDHCQVDSLHRTELAHTNPADRLPCPTQTSSSKLEGSDRCGFHLPIQMTTSTYAETRYFSIRGRHEAREIFLECAM